MIEKNEKNEYLGNVYEDILNIKITPKDSFETLINRFYEVMTKWGICQGTWTENGRACSNAEWCMCWNSFESHIRMQIMLMNLKAEPPAHLLAYGEKPKEKV